MRLPNGLITVCEERALTSAGMKGYGYKIIEIYVKICII